jgi:hypothetical protein
MLAQEKHWPGQSKSGLHSSFATNAKNRSIWKERESFFGTSKTGRKVFSDPKRKREELLKTFQPILNVPKPFAPIQKGWNDANEMNLGWAKSFLKM